NNNGVVDPGELIALQVDLTNGGSATAAGVSGMMAVTGGSATMTNASSTYADIAADATKTNDADYLLMVSPSQACGGDITVAHTITYGAGQTHVIVSTIQVGAPVLGAAVNYSYTGP